MATSCGDQRSYVTTGGIPNEFELVTKATYLPGGSRRSTRRFACRWPARHDSSLLCRMRGIPAARIIVRNEFEHPQLPKRPCHCAGFPARRRPPRLDAQSFSRLCLRRGVSPRTRDNTAARNHGPGDEFRGSMVRPACNPGPRVPCDAFRTDRARHPARRRRWGRKWRAWATSGHRPTISKISHFRRAKVEGGWLFFSVGL
jgi:hypothetical protein